MEKDNEKRLLKQLERAYLEELGRKHPLLAVRGKLFTKANLEKAKIVASQRILERHSEKYLEVVGPDERESKQYREWREAVLVRDNYTCQDCGITRQEIEEIKVLAKKAGATWFCRLEVHHIKPYSKFPDLRLDIDNGQTLCADCHVKFPPGRQPKKLKEKSNPYGY